MAIDPSISLGVKTPQINIDVPSPLQQFGQMLSMRGLMEQQQLRRTQIAQEQEQLDALRQSRASEAEFRKRLTAGETLTPGQTIGILGSKAGSLYLKSAADLEESRHKANIERSNRLGAIVGSATDTPTYNRAVMQAQSEGYYDPETARQLIGQGYDPKRVEQYRTMAMTAAQQATADLAAAKAKREATESATLVRQRGLEYAAQTAPNQDQASWDTWRAGLQQTNPEVLPLIPPQYSPGAYQMVRQYAVKPTAPVPGRDIPLPADVAAQQREIKAPQPQPAMSPERLGQELRLRQASAAGAAGTAGGPDVAQTIAEGIISGNQPPVTTGLYRYGAAVRSELQKRGYDLSTAKRDWDAIQKHLATLNGQQQERLRQAVDFTYHSIDQVEQAFNEWKDLAGPSGFKILNRGALAASKQLPGRMGATAANLEALVADFTSELGTVYKGGSSSTDESLKLAAENLKTDWNAATFDAALKRIRESLQIRRNSINSSQPVGVSPNSPYLPPTPSAAAPAAAAKPAGGPPVGTVVDGHRFKGGDPNKQENWEEVKR